MQKKTIITILIILIIPLAIILILRSLTNPPISNNNPLSVVIASPEPSASPIIQSGIGDNSSEFLEWEKNFLEQTPVLQHLPFDHPDFEISYINEQHLVIHSKTSNKQRDYQGAKDWYTANGIDISKIQFDYK